MAIISFECFKRGAHNQIPMGGDNEAQDQIGAALAGKTTSTVECPYDVGGVIRVITYTDAAVFEIGIGPDVDNPTNGRHSLPPNSVGDYEAKEGDTISYKILDVEA